MDSALKARTRLPKTIVYGAIPTSGSERLPQTLVIATKRQGFPADRVKTR